MDHDWSNLISGSDLRGVAMETPKKAVTLTDEAARAAAYIFARTMAREMLAPVRIAVGHDSRLSAPRLKAAVFSGLAAAGAHILDCGLCTTPAMFMITLDERHDCQGAIMITASHLPSDRNGLKFMNPEGGLTHGQIEELVRSMEAIEVPETVPSPDEVSAVDYLSQYARELCAYLREATQRISPLQGMRIIVDAGNGAGGFFAERVLAALGANTVGSINLEPDGRFPAHPPNPESPEAMAALSRAVTDNHANLGILFDADCDRAAIADENGREINRNRLIALTASIVLRDHPGGTIVTDSVTSHGLRAFIQGHGGTHRRFKRGYRNVIDEARRLCDLGIDAPLAMETSGHAAFADHHFLDDGAYLIVRLLCEAARLNEHGRALSDAIVTLLDPADEAELRMPILEKDFQTAGGHALERFSAAMPERPGFCLDRDNAEGVRVSRGGEDAPQWMLLRQSVHDPLLVLNMESNAEGGCATLAECALEALYGAPGLDLSALEAYVRTHRKKR